MALSSSFCRASAALLAAAAALCGCSSASTSQDTTLSRTPEGDATGSFPGSPAATAATSSTTPQVAAGGETGVLPGVEAAMKTDAGYTFTVTDARLPFVASAGDSSMDAPGTSSFTITAEPSLLVTNTTEGKVIVQSPHFDLYPLWKKGSPVCSLGSGGNGPNPDPPIIAPGGPTGWCTSPTDVNDVDGSIYNPSGDLPIGGSATFSGTFSRRYLVNLDDATNVVAALNSPDGWLLLSDDATVVKSTMHDLAKNCQIGPAVVRTFLSTLTIPGCGG